MRSAKLQRFSTMLNLENTRCMLVNMEIKIISEKNNPFFKRKDIRIEISHPGKTTPSKAELIKEIAAKFSVPEDKIRIDYIFTKKGISESEANIKIFQVKEEVKEEKKATRTGEKIGKAQRPASARIL